MSAPLPRYRLFLRDMEIVCRIGIHDFERATPQRVRINLSLWVSRAEDGDRIADVLNYERIRDQIHHLAEQDHINLLETLAERILGFCLSEEQVHGARVTVEKPDIFPEMEGVGIEMERWGSDIEETTPERP